MSYQNPAGLIVVGLVIICFVIAAIVIALGDETGSGTTFYEPTPRPKRKPRVTIEKRRDYDDSTRTLKETTTKTKIFPEIVPEDFLEVDEDV